jgi:hypothetical protein
VAEAGWTGASDLVAGPAAVAAAAKSSEALASNIEARRASETKPAGMRSAAEIQTLLQLTLLDGRFLVSCPAVATKTVRRFAHLATNLAISYYHTTSESSSSC